MRGGINKRITAMQNHSLGILTRFGMYAVENNNIGTRTSYPSLVQRLGFTLFMTQFRRLLIAGFSFFAQGFSPLRKWTFGAGYNHQAVVLQPFFFLTSTTSPYYSYLMFLGLVLTIKPAESCCQITKALKLT